jgi:hypothetical protein
LIQGMAVEPPSDIDEYKEWRYKQVTGLEIIKGAVLESIHDGFAALGKLRDCIKDLLNLIQSLYTAQGLVYDY